jgi:hypothetical protein
MSTSHARRASHSDRQPPSPRARLGGGALLLLTGLLSACSQNSINFDTKLDQGVQALFSQRKSPQQYMLLAVSSEDSDIRRDAVARINKSKDYDKEWAIKGYVAIACLESEPQTRCIAIRALARTGDPRATEPALKILNSQTYPPQEVWPPTPLVRWDATLALADLSAGGKVPDDQKEAVRRTLLDRLRLDTFRHARLAGARGLAYYPDHETIKALIEGLRDEDYAVAHECEGALVKLTGVTHNANPGEWEEWLDANESAAFEHAGEIPPSRRLPYNNAVEKSWYDTQQLVRWLWPGAKEQ